MRFTVAMLAIVVFLIIVFKPHEGWSLNEKGEKTINVLKGK